MAQLPPVCRQSVCYPSPWQHYWQQQQQSRNQNMKSRFWAGKLLPNETDTWKLKGGSWYWETKVNTSNNLCFSSCSQLSWDLSHLFFWELVVNILLGLPQHLSWLGQIIIVSDSFNNSRHDYIIHRTFMIELYKIRTFMYYWLDLRIGLSQKQKRSKFSFEEEQSEMIQMQINSFIFWHYGLWFKKISIDPPNSRLMQTNIYMSCHHGVGANWLVKPEGNL